MTQTRKTTTRRAFFASGGAMLGAGVAATAVAAAPSPAMSELEQLKAEVARSAARDAIRELHARFLAAMQAQSYGAVPALFEDGATLALGGLTACGRGAIAGALDDQYRCQSGVELHTAYRHDALRDAGTVTVADDGHHATATFPVEVEISAPLVGDSAVIAMARLQGHVADRRWEHGRFEVEYTSRAGQWMITSLNYASA
ncbi:MAG: nuclear transport factor 2 family protein [Steroidobacteraceae bacterium]